MELSTSTPQVFTLYVSLDYAPAVLPLPEPAEA